MKFDHVIMNPPYCRNLHLKILNEAINHSDDIVNLSPNFYENYKKLKNVPIASDIEIIPRDKAKTLFNGIQLPFNLSIQHFVVNKHDNSILTRFIPEIYNIFKNIKLNKTFSDVFIRDYDQRDGCAFVPLKLMTSTWDKNKDLIVDKLGIIVDGKTLDDTFYKDKRNKNKNRPCGGIYFKTLEEAHNFIAFTKTKFFIAMVKAMHTNSRYILSEYPFMPTYTHPWTDDDLYKYFNLSDDEIRIIENEIK